MGTEPGDVVIDTGTPHSARMWNYWLGGKDNYAADRELGDRIRDAYPDIVQVAQQSRRFLGRAVRYVTESAGVRQFLDIGTGLPTADNTHEIAQRFAPESRIVYVDNDPLVLVHARALLSSHPAGATSYVDCDVRDPDKILHAAAELLDFGKPIALMLLGIMGQILDDDAAYRITKRLVDALPAGSYLIVEDGTGVVSPDAAKKAEEVREEGGDPYRLRTPAQLARFFDGLELLEPGVVTVSQWRPEPHAVGEPAPVAAFGGVARKP
jgi:S-adenosyl methyltransferase